MSLTYALKILKNVIINQIFFYFWPRRAACKILVPRSGIEPMPPAVEALSPNHRTTRELPQTKF